MQSIVMSTSVCVSMCVSVRVSVCPRGYFRKHARAICTDFCACCLRPWLMNKDEYNISVTALVDIREGCIMSVMPFTAAAQLLMALRHRSEEF